MSMMRPGEKMVLLIYVLTLYAIAPSMAPCKVVEFWWIYLKNATQDDHLFPMIIMYIYHFENVVAKRVIFA